jgi:hypothetical protein
LVEVAGHETGNRLEMFTPAGSGEKIRRGTNYFAVGGFE